jgi:hypothetical protein
MSENRPVEKPPVSVRRKRPIPRNGRGKYPFDSLKVGESFTLDNYREARSCSSASIQWRARRKSNRQFIVQRDLAWSLKRDRWRCWRVA